jgi:hypothetical protein
MAKKQLDSLKFDKGGLAPPSILSKTNKKLSDQTFNMLNPQSNTISQPVLSPMIQSALGSSPEELTKEIENYVENVNKTENPIQAVLYANMLVKKDDKIQLNLDENIEEHVDPIKGFFRNALGIKEGDTYDPKEKAWCAAFVDATLTKIGADRLKDKYSRIRAKEYINYGKEVNLKDIREGDIVIFDWNGNGEGEHVTFYTGKRLKGKGMFDVKDAIRVLGGNQSGMGAKIGLDEYGRSDPTKQGAVSVKSYPTSKILSIRRITRNNTPWEGVKDENPLLFYQGKKTPSYGMQQGGLSGRNRPRRTVSEDFEKRSREAGKQIVETVAGMLPGVGTAMTAEEIRKELQKEDPNYRKIALLGGAELIGLIPGLGTAAKAGLRKVADKVGAGKIVEALDAPKPKPESEIFAGETGLLPREKSKRRRSSQISEKTEVPKYSLPTAKTMKDSGKSNKEIEDATGLIYDDKTNMFRFEINDQNAQINYFPKGDVDEILSEDMRLEEFLNHPELFSRYPQLRDYNLRIKNSADMGSSLGTFGASTKTISLSTDLFKSKGADSVENIKDTLFHEIQHGVQYIENFEKDLISGVTGASAKRVAKLGKDPVLEKLRGNVANLTKEFDDIQDKLNTGTATPEEFDRLLELNEKIGFSYVSLKNQAYQKYLKNLGEAESRTVGLRATQYADNTTPILEQRAKEAELDYYNPLIGGTMSMFVASDAYRTSSLFDEGRKILSKTFKMPPEDINKMFDKYYDQDLKDQLISDGKKLGRDLNIKAGLSLNKGGTVMNKQMEMAFMQQGGLKDDGMRKDPVSGNEVPSGSMAKEVRDDIPAQLSEGEYVVPADVVRFFGVKYFEDLRNKAKDGLNKMDKDGRIGGEPVPVGGPKAGPMGRQMAMGGDLTSEELQEIKKMAEGGMVQMSDPYQQQQSMYQQPRAMQSGGITGEFVTSTGPAPPQRPIYTGEFSYEKPGAGAYQPPAGTQQTQQTPVTLYGPNGEVITLMLPKDQVRYNELIAQGYTTTAPTVVTPQPRDDDDDDDEGGEDNPTWMDNYDYTNFDNLAQQTSAALDGPTTMLGSAAEFVFGGGVLGKFAKASNAAQVAANIAILKAQGQDVSGLTDKFNNYVNDNNLGGLKNFITGSRLAKQINTTQVDVGLFKDSTDVFGNKIFKTVEEFNKQMQKNAPKGMVYKPDDDDDDGGGYVRPEGVSAAPDTSIRPPSRPSGSSSSSGSGSSSLAPSTKPKPKPASGGQDNNPNAPASPSPSYARPSRDPYAERRNKGGLMQKKKKK